MPEFDYRFMTYEDLVRHYTEEVKQLDDDTLSEHMENALDLVHHNEANEDDGAYLEALLAVRDEREKHATRAEQTASN